LLIKTQLNPRRTPTTTGLDSSGAALAVQAAAIRHGQVVRLGVHIVTAMIRLNAIQAGPDELIVLVAFKGGLGATNRHHACDRSDE